MIIGCDFHPSWQQVSWLDTETGETGERKLVHAEGDADRVIQAPAPCERPQGAGHPKPSFHLLRSGPPARKVTSCRRGRPRPCSRDNHVAPDASSGRFIEPQSLHPRADPNSLARSRGRESETDLFVMAGIDAASR